MEPKPLPPVLPPPEPETSRPKPNRQSSPGAVGNTTGLIVPKPSPHGGIEEGRPTALTRPPDEPSLLERFKQSVDDKIDGAVEASGYSVPAMVLGSVAKAANEVFMPTAWWELVPVGKAAKVVKKGAEVLGVVKKGEKVAEAAKDVKKAEQATDAATDVKKGAGAEKEAAEGGGKGNKENGGHSKGKGKLKCGDHGSYKDLKKKTAGGKFDRDHIPSKAALKARAEELAGEKLSSTQRKAIDNWGNTIAIPRQAHIDVSPTHGQSLADAAKDANNLQGSSRRDVEAMLKEIEKYDADGNCKKAYQKGAAKIMRMSNDDYDQALLEILKKVK
jgi:hypothetical protein